MAPVSNPARLSCLHAARERCPAGRVCQSMTCRSCAEVRSRRARELRSGDIKAATKAVAAGAKAMADQAARAMNPLRSVRTGDGGGEAMNIEDIDGATRVVGVSQGHMGLSLRDVVIRATAVRR